MDTTNGPAPTPAGSETSEVPAGASGREEEYVTLADADEGESDDSEGDESQDGEGEAGEDAGNRPRRRPGSARLKDRVRALERENEELRRTRQAQRAPADDPDDDLVEPREQDFPNDYLAYDRALREYQTRKAIRDENQRVAWAESLRHAVTEHRERLAGYNVRLEELKDRIPDFDRVMVSAGNLHIRNDVRDLILGSPKGPLIAYHLARNPDKIADLNRMSPASAAKEVGSIEARIRGPKPRTVTRAKAPAQAPKGGTASRGANPSDMSMADYIAARKAGTI
jgi:hypothetical protein